MATVRALQEIMITIEHTLSYSHTARGNDRKYEHVKVKPSSVMIETVLDIEGQTQSGNGCIGHATITVARERRMAMRRICRCR